MGWFRRRQAKHARGRGPAVGAHRAQRLLPPVAVAPPWPTAPSAGAPPTTTLSPGGPADEPPQPSVQIVLADGSTLAMSADDPRAVAFRAVADALTRKDAG